MLAYTYIERGRFELKEKPVPQIKDARDAIVRVTLGSICTSDLHIKHGSVPRAVPGITVGHEMVGIVEQVGAEVRNVKPGDRVTVNVETFCGECFFCKHGYVNNCEDPDGGVRLPNRRRTGRICKSAARRQRTQPHTRQRNRRAGTLHRRHTCHRILGSTHIRNYIRRHSNDNRCRSDRHMHPAVRHAP